MRRWRRVVGLGVAGLVGAAASLLGAGAAVGAEDPLRVMTFNIHHGAGTDDVLDLEHTARVIEESGAEVIGLQEVDRHWGERSAFVDEAAWLAERLGMEVVYGANLDEDPAEPGQPRRQYGTALLSAYDIVRSKNTYLPAFEGSEQRGLLETMINVDGTMVRVYNTHLQHDDAAERLVQAEAILQRLPGGRQPIVLVGDLNAVQGTPEIETLERRLVDAWTVVGEGDGYTIPVDAPNRRIDYVMTSANVEPVAAEVVATDASDHLPVVVDLLVPTRGDRG